MQLSDPPSASGSAAVPLAQSAPAWPVARASLELVLDIEAIGRRRRNHDLIDGVLFAAVLAANLTLVQRDPDLQRAYATIDQPAPEHLRRPVSVNGVAHSLGMPFETVRRRIRAMVEAGLLTATPRGVYVPGSVLLEPVTVATLLDRHARLHQFYRDVQSAGVLADLPGADPSAGPPAEPVRITNRALAEYFLRAIDGPVRLAGDILTGLVLVGMVRENLAPLNAAQVRAWATNPAAHGAPIRTGALAERLGLSRETCRRYALALEAAGLCRRTDDGLLAVAGADVRAQLDEMAAANLTNVQRLFARLGQLGVLAHWDAEPPAWRAVG
ncbi:MAG: hypothetical protein ACOY5Y_06165 [Pseudomonadota bacterium]